MAGVDLVDEMEKVFAVAGDPPQVLRLDSGPEFISMHCTSPAIKGWAGPTSRPGRRGTTGTSNRSITGNVRSALIATTGTPSSKAAQSSATSISQPPTPSLSPGAPHAGRVCCRTVVDPYPGGLLDQLDPKSTAHLDLLRGVVGEGVRLVQLCVAKSPIDFVARLLWGWRCS